jgi:hypothetical protein
MRRFLAGASMVAGSIDQVMERKDEQRTPARRAVSSGAYAFIQPPPARRHSNILLGAPAVGSRIAVDAAPGLELP